MNSTNPVKAAKDSGSRGKRNSSFQEARVMFADGDDDTQSVIVSPVGKDTQFPAKVPAMTNGDTHVPTQGTPVLVARQRDGMAVIVAVYYSEKVTAPTSIAGERRIGHESSNAEVYFHDDGRITLTADDGTEITLDNNAITVNNGSTPVVTDVTTTKDADGHVTSVDTVTNDSIQL